MIDLVGYARSLSAIATLWLLLTSLSLPALAAAGCYDVSMQQPRSLSGVLDYRMFPGPPNYEDIQKGDTPEPAYILRLFRAICLTGDEAADPARAFDEVHLVSGKSTAGAMRALVGSSVVVRLYDQMPSHTGHHRRPLVAWVSDIQPLDDPTQEYGTAATTVRAFYYALGGGNGDIASSFVIPEKTRKGPFSPEKLSQFYGALLEPLSLVSLRPLADDLFEVQYQFRSASGFCNGKALVRTEQRGGRSYIASIKAMDGC